MPTRTTLAADFAQSNRPKRGRGARRVGQVLARRWATGAGVTEHDGVYGQACARDELRRAQNTIGCVSTGIRYVYLPVAGVKRLRYADCSSAHACVYNKDRKHKRNGKFDVTDYAMHHHRRRCCHRISPLKIFLFFSPTTRLCAYL